MKYIMLFENWKDQGESNPEFEKDVLHIIQDFNYYLRSTGVSIEDLLDKEKFENFLINCKTGWGQKRYPSLGNSRGEFTVSFNFSHIKNGKKIYFYDETFFDVNRFEPDTIKEYHTCYLIEDDKCIGVCKYTLDIREGKKIYIVSKIGVISSKRRKGYGTDILNHIEKLNPGYSYYDKTDTTIKGDRFFHKVRGSKLFYSENRY